MNRRQSLALAMVGLLLLSGCNSLSLSGPAVTQPRVELASGDTPALVFNYSVDDYATVLLENPAGRVVSEDRLEPEQSVDALRMGEPQPGTYTIVVQQGGETVTTREVTFQGANPQITDVSAVWSGSRVQQVVVDVENTGDLPVRIQAGSFSARGQTVESGEMYHWIPVNGSTQIELSAPFDDTIKIEEPGGVKGTVSLETRNTSLEGEFEKTFEGPNVTITEVRQNWEGPQLRSVSVAVQNTGDMETRGDVSVQYAGETLGNAEAKDIPAGGGAEWDIDTLGYLYEAEQSGNLTFDVVANTDSGFTSTSFVHYVEPGDVALQSMRPVWEAGELTRIEFEAVNTGDVEADFEVAVTVNGEQLGTVSYEIGPGTTREFGVYPDGFQSSMYSAGAGSTTVELTLSDGSGSSSKSATKQFEGRSTSFSDVSATFFNNYGSDTVDLSSLKFYVSNTGDIPVTYDSIRVSVGGVTVTDDLYGFEKTLDAGQANRETVFAGQTAIPTGTHDLTIELLYRGEVVAETTVSVSATT